MTQFVVPLNIAAYTSISHLFVICLYIYLSATGHVQRAMSFLRLWLCNPSFQAVDLFLYIVVSDNLRLRSILFHSVSTNHFRGTQKCLLYTLNYILVSNVTSCLFTIFSVDPILNQANAFVWPLSKIALHKDDWFPTTGSGSKPHICEVKVNSNRYYVFASTARGI